MGVSTTRTFGGADSGPRDGDDGLRFLPGYLDRDAQSALLGALGPVFAAAPLYTPTMPRFTSAKELSTVFVL